jgi:hypothetical protein
MTGFIQPAPSPNKPEPAFPKQAIVVIHGIGEQKPMDTLRSFVHAVWETDADVTKNGLPNPAEVWSKPDLRTGSLELRRIATRQSAPSDAFKEGVRSDFYELYWADLSGGSTWDQVKDWILGLLLRNPFTRVPRGVFLAWLALWALALSVVYFVIAAVLPKDAAFVDVRPWDFPPLVWVSAWQRWQLGLVGIVVAIVEHRFVVRYVGRIVRYTRATPDNIAARKKIRERGLQLLTELHNQEYDRIVVVGHSLGSVLAYDLISYFWASRYDQRTVEEGSPEFRALVNLENALTDWNKAIENSVRDDCRTIFLNVQRAFAELLRLRPKPQDGEPDGRWLITDLITLGSPLGHAEFLIAHDAHDLRRHQADRELPMCPPIREVLDPADAEKAEAAGFSIDQSPALFCFPFGTKRWQLHHAAPFSVVKWTNIHDPARFIMCGDIISGAVSPVFGPAITDINLRLLRGQSWRFSHTLYWSLDTDDRKRITALRRSLNLAYRKGN